MAFKTKRWITAAWRDEIDPSTGTKAMGGVKVEDEVYEFFSPSKSCDYFVICYIAIITTYTFYVSNPTTVVIL